MCRPSLVHPKPIRRLRDLTRYRRSLVRERSREKQRLEKVLEDAQIKLDTVVASLLSVSGRAMIEAMIAGERDPHVPAGMARGVMRRKIPQLEEALRGHFDDHHGFICATMLRRIDALAADIATLDPIGHSGAGPAAVVLPRRLEPIARPRPCVSLRSARTVWLWRLPSYSGSVGSWVRCSFRSSVSVSVQPSGSVTAIQASALACRVYRCPKPSGTEPAAGRSIST